MKGIFGITGPPYPLMAYRIFLVSVVCLLELVPQTLSDGCCKGSGFKCSNDISKPVCIPDNYSKFELPHTEQTNVIGIAMDIDEVMEISDKDYSITIAMYFNVFWYEPRLKLVSSVGASLRPENSTEPVLVPTSVDLIQDLWLPNPFIYNLKTFKLIDGAMSKLSGLWIASDKKLTYGQTTHITFICPMKFNKFPFDTQICKFRVGSYNQDSSKVLFVTKHYGFSSKKANSIALDYGVLIKELAPEDSVLDYGPLGNFTIAGFEMVLSRYVSTYIIAFFIPSGLFVVVSWISFLIPSETIGGRISLLVTLLLLLVTIFTCVVTTTPRAEGLKAIEVWMLACILFVFAALIQYVAFLFRKQHYLSKMQKMTPKTAEQLAEEFWRIDKFFLVCFPALFIVFNVVFWIVYLN